MRLRHGKRLLTTTVVVAAALAPAAPAKAAHDHAVPAVAGGHDGATFVRGKTTQVWRIRASDKTGDRMVAVTIWAAPVIRAHVEVFDARWPVPQPWHGGSLYTTEPARRRRGGVALTGPSDQSLTLRRVRRRWELRVRSPEVAAKIRLTPIAPGAMAGPWRFEARQEDGRRPKAWWATPAPLARARVYVRSEDWTTSFRSRRGYLDRTWGSLALDQGAYSRWALAQLWAGRKAFALPMLGDSADVSGPAAHDPITRAILVKASRRGTTVCPAQVAWVLYLPYDEPGIRGRCGRSRLVLVRTMRRRGQVLGLGAEEETYWERETDFLRRMKFPYGSGTLDFLFYNPF
jgi:hypothetical protein